MNGDWKNISKEKLDKKDVGLIVERIDVYGDRLDIRLKADISELLMLDVSDDSEPLPDSISQDIMHRRPKVLSINVINDIIITIQFIWTNKCISIT